MVSWFGGWWYTVDLHKRRNIHELSSATMLVSLKLASKDLGCVWRSLLRDSAIIPKHKLQPETSIL